MAKYIDVAALRGVIGDFNLFEVLDLDDDDNITARLTTEAHLYASIYGTEALVERAQECLDPDLVDLLRFILHMANIAEIPAADVVPVVRGEWISLTECSNAGVYCSVCHKKVWKEDYAWCNRKNKLRSNYCPNCGARMKGEQS